MILTHLFPHDHMHTGIISHLTPASFTKPTHHSHLQFIKAVFHFILNLCDFNPDVY